MVLKTMRKLTKNVNPPQTWVSVRIPPSSPNNANERSG